MSSVACKTKQNIQAKWAQKSYCISMSHSYLYKKLWFWGMIFLFFNLTKSKSILDMSWYLMGMKVQKMFALVVHHNQKWWKKKSYEKPFQNSLHLEMYRGPYSFVFSASLHCDDFFYVFSHNFNRSHILMFIIAVFGFTRL